jgi:hypothetical protein
MRRARARVGYRGCRRAGITIIAAGKSESERTRFDPAAMMAFDVGAGCESAARRIQDVLPEKVG